MKKHEFSKDSTKPDPSKKTYILEMKDGTRQKITVPKEWKVSFGALFPGKDLNSGRSAMRFWEGNKENQRAVFTDVESFRDTDIGIEVERTQVTEQGITAKTELGDKHIVVRGEVKEWVNPDDPKAAKADPQFLRIEDKFKAANLDQAGSSKKRGR